MKLNKGTTVRHHGQTYRGECPDDVAMAVGLKEYDTPKEEAAKPKPKKEVKP